MWQEQGVHAAARAAARAAALKREAARAFQRSWPGQGGGRAGWESRRGGQRPRATSARQTKEAEKDILSRPTLT